MKEAYGIYSSHSLNLILQHLNIASFCIISNLARFCVITITFQHVGWFVCIVQEVQVFWKAYQSRLRITSAQLESRLRVPLECCKATCHHTMPLLSRNFSTEVLSSWEKQTWMNLQWGSCIFLINVLTVFYMQCNKKTVAAVEWSDCIHLCGHIGAGNVPSKSLHPCRL